MRKRCQPRSKIKREIARLHVILPGAAAFLSLVALEFLLIGCNSAKSPLTNWNSRIGNYTYQLALQDLGVPMRSATLSNGSIVADWLTEKSKTGSPDVSDAELSSGYESPVVANNLIPMGSKPTPNHYLRLTFGPDQKLTGWKKYSQYYSP